MKVITTHLNADFDCLASMMAAKKLYPDAHLILPGSSERLVDEFLEEGSLAMGFTRLKDIVLDQVEGQCQFPPAGIFVYRQGFQRGAL